jgi:hypothetical protein
MLRLSRERREEDVGHAKTTRSRDFAEGWSRQDRGGAVERRIAALGKTDRRSESVEHVEDAKERVKRQIGRPSTVTNFRKQVIEIVQETPDLASLEILRRVRESGYAGGKTALYARVA